VLHPIDRKDDWLFDFYRGWTKAIAFLSLTSRNEDDLAIYYKLIEEMRGSQEKGLKNSEWISWHEGAHLISKGPTGSKTYREIQEKISRYFGINNKSVGTRFNWYRDSSDWKPFHHDSAAYNPQRGKD
jgi:hypothetical protein